MIDIPRCTIQMVKAGEGDCFLLRFTFESKKYNLLIDGGPARCWESGLKLALDDLISAGERVNLMIITHIDSDHIGGAIKLFSLPKFSALVDEIWFNGLKQVLQAPTNMPGKNIEAAYEQIVSLHRHSYGALDGPISAEEAASLEEKLDAINLQANSRFDGQAISKSLGLVHICPGLSIDVLLPTEKSLDKLKNKFHIAVEQAAPGSSLYISKQGERSFEAVLLDCDCGEDAVEAISAFVPTGLQIEKWKDVKAVRDTSVTNGSSIAICVNFFGKKILLTGDAHAEGLIAVLRERREIYGVYPFFDVVKMPHHGASNNCVKLLEHIDGRYFLISSDGIKFCHPSKETLAKIISRPTQNSRDLFFNYDNQMFLLFNDSHAESKYCYKLYLADRPIYI